ncbi:MAG: chlorophyll synthesis pathway protein BchC [Pseudomonadota bacterium]
MRQDAAVRRSRTEAAPAYWADAIVFTGDRRAELAALELTAPAEGDVVVDVEWSGVSSGTERLLWSGEMPPFPGLGYPLVPGYEAVGRVVRAEDRRELIGRRVFVPGARCFEGAHGLFGASASRIIAPADRIATLPELLGVEAVLLALAATAHHALAAGPAPDLVVGHGVLGRLIVRVSRALGGDPPVVWEVEPERADGDGYAVIDPDCDGRTDYRAIYDVSGDSGLLDELISRLAPQGEIVLAGFYSDRLSFAFPPAFMREARLRIAAEWARSDLDAVLQLVAADTLSLDGLITHQRPAADAATAYSTAFEDPSCLKMVLDWSSKS